MDAEARLAALWAEAAPPAHDPAFALAVAERIERRIMWRRVCFELMPMVAMLGIAAWALAPAMEDLIAVSLANTAAPAGTGLAIALSVVLGVWLAVGRPREA
jgi:hypothetical protein